MPDSLKKWFPYFLIAGMVVNIIGLFTGILEPDSALYASIAKHIAVTNDWVNLFGSGHEWLDKPHLPFWLCALSFKCFGINAFAYKLPAFLCWLVGVYYTYKLAQAIYGDSTARLSVIIYITAMHVVLSNLDVRAEAFLTAFIVAAIYHIYKAMSYKWLQHIFIGALYCALAVMTKGIFVLVTIAAGFVMYWIVTKQYKQLLQPKWFLLILLTCVFITPELYCLYEQFDIHPEKIVFGQTNVSGLKFFFWDSQFGRFFNNGPIKGSGDIFFFTHTFLWAFIPWSLVTVIAVGSLLIKRGKLVNKEALIIGGSVLVTFIMFSVSKFQLPHYIVIIFPQFAIITAVYLLSIRSPKVLHRLNIVQFLLYLGSIFLILFITYKSDLSHWYIPLVLIILLTPMVVMVFKGNSLTSLVGKNICLSMLVYLFYHLYFYPPLMQYQAGMIAGKWLNEHSISNNVIMYKSGSESFEFYSHAPVSRVSNMDSLPVNININKPIIVYAPIKEMEELKMKDNNLKIIHQFNYFHLTKLTWKFLKKETRQGETGKYVLAEYSAIHSSTP